MSLAAALLLPAPGCKDRDDGGCETDFDCKGERICVDGSCAYPRAHGGGESSAGPQQQDARATDPRKLMLKTRMRLSKYRHLAEKWARSHDESCPDDLSALHATDGGTPERERTDAWGNPFVLECGVEGPGPAIGVVSPGPDGDTGTEDDMRTW